VRALIVWRVRPMLCRCSQLRGGLDALLQSGASAALVARPTAGECAEMLTGCTACWPRCSLLFFFASCFFDRGATRLL
jgi:hypothetical protein